MTTPIWSPGHGPASCFLGDHPSFSLHPELTATPNILPSQFPVWACLLISLRVRSHRPRRKCLPDHHLLFGPFIFSTWRQHISQSPSEKLCQGQNPSRLPCPSCTPPTSNQSCAMLILSPELLSPRQSPLCASCTAERWGHF